ncbi:addiction module protein [Calothrix membranacea FACHB-236]|nr:addiction module protein [Calothrix membranacea FACHB-236]
MSSHPLLKIDISELSVAERIQLAEDLWDSILEQQEQLPLSEAQQQELDQRLESYQKNPANGSSWEEVKKRLGFSNFCTCF